MLNMATKRFFKEASQWKMPKAFMLKAREASTIKSYLEWEVWVLRKQDQEDDFNAIHEAWLRTGVIPRRISITDRTRMVGFMLTFLEYDRVKRNQTKVNIL